MTGLGVLQRRIAETDHIGPLQTCWRKWDSSADAVTPATARRTLAGLAEPSGGCGEPAELHPAVLEPVGLGPAVAQLASTAQRSRSIKILHRNVIAIRSGIGPIVCGVVAL